MKVIRAKNAGFCWGVRRAVEMAEKAAQTAVEAASAGTPEPGIWTDGPLIHNHQEIARLATVGVRVCNDPAGLPEGAALLIRAHGIPASRYRWLERLGLRLIDATCPNVARIHKIVSEAAAAGRYVLVLGDPQHAEVVGILGCCTNPGACVVDSPEAVDALSEDALPRDGDGVPMVTFVSQTTQNEALFDTVAEAIRRRWPAAYIINTICGATQARQRALSELADESDCIVVVGSVTSANTMRLASLARAKRPTIVVETADELRPDDFRGRACVGVTAGASTPESVIAAVEARLRSFSPDPSSASVSR